MNNRIRAVKLCVVSILLLLNVAYLCIYYNYTQIVDSVDNDLGFVNNYFDKMDHLESFMRENNISHLTTDEISQFTHVSDDERIRLKSVCSRIETVKSSYYGPIKFLMVNIVFSIVIAILVIVTDSSINKKE